MGRDHSCEGCGNGGFNNDLPCECPLPAKVHLLTTDVPPPSPLAARETYARRRLTEDERRIIATDEAWARATGNPRKWAVIVDRQGNQSIATTFQ